LRRFTVIDKYEHQHVDKVVIARKRKGNAAITNVLTSLRRSHASLLDTGNP
jgi:hypothetical protein